MAPTHTRPATEHAMRPECELHFRVIGDALERIDKRTESLDALLRNGLSSRLASVSAQVRVQYWLIGVVLIAVVTSLVRQAVGG